MEHDFVMVEKEDGCSRDDPPKYLSEISLLVDSLADPLWSLNTFIHDNPELAFEEFKTHDALVKFMRSQDGWQVTPSACGIKTAWIATFNLGKPGPVVSFNAEMDALPGLGHACGHNLIAIASLAAGLTAACIVKRHGLGGKIVIFGTPGEEGYRGGKILLLERGAYQDVDISLISHPGILHNSPLVRTTAFARLEVEYFGKAAHAGKSPWEGINALDAVVVAYNAISVLRQQTKPDDVIGLAITDGGKATNVIHAYASCVCMIHTGTWSRLEALCEKVSKCFQAGAGATGAKVNITLTEGYKDHVPNRVLAASYTEYWNQLPNVPEPQIPPCEQLTHVPSSTDQGNLSYALPSLNASFAIPPAAPGRQGQPHSPEFEVASGTYEAFERALRVGKALAGTAIDVLTEPGLLGKIKRQWEQDMAAKAAGASP
ncbi:hypothetical protein QBC47DRAFT_406856 [Echria macrotheca]|uniref:Peptidase M20 domain-containing protein 2 n=1 Tax=Echria macrotheca TaxID=438768 RepID=A0AAJ0B2M8_9PEZI|nr:hypothetical protein QBC47DRAFT_406856 [Echria macrotheca]